MAEITKYSSVSITELMGRLDAVKFNPSTINRVVLEYLDEITNGTVNIVDPTNPFVFLLESSAVNTALAINESAINLRKQYASLAQTEDDLYQHMSDKDFLYRFATPSETSFTMVFQANDVLNKLVYDSVEKCYKAIIPRDTEFSIDGTIFTLQYPIVLRKFVNGMVQISYDATILSPLSTLSSNIIDYTLRTDSNNVSWIFFKVPLRQFAINTTYFPLQKSAVFSQDIDYSDQYYYIRAFYKNANTNSSWVEMATTHTEQVFDPYKPTAVVKVYDTLVNVSIPVVYFTSNLISGEVRFDVYTTKGETTANLANYKVDAFSVKFRAIDEERDVNVYTNAITELAYYMYGDALVTGGTNKLSFMELRERTIFNTNGDINLPVTNVDISTYVNDSGFDLVKNTDVLTNRIFLATQKLPKPLNDKLVTSANIGISPFIESIANLKALSTVKNNNLRITLLSSNLYLNNNGVISILPKTEIDALKSMPKQAMVALVNSRQYLYSPFYYVFDSSMSEFEVRAYNLDYPAASALSFISQNQTIQLPVNTDSYSMTKVTNGYKLTILTKSGNFYKQLGNNLVGVQLAYYPEGESNLAYINGSLDVTLDSGERVYSFTIETNYDIDSKNRLCVTNAAMASGGVMKTWINLEHKFHIFYTTSSITDAFVASDADSLIGKFMLPANSVATTYETILLKTGSALKRLWTKARSLPTGLNYKVWPTDIPLYYETDIYQKDPVTGSIFTVVNGEIVYNILHHRGDPVLDNAGLQVYKHKAGDIVLDSNGRPVVDDELSSAKEIDMLYVEGKHYFVDDAAMVDYNKEMVSVLDTWITGSIANIQAILLEQTKIFFYPKTTLGKVKILTEGGNNDYLSSEQSLTLDLYVKSNVYSDDAVRKSLTTASIKLLDKYISMQVVNITEIVKALSVLYGDSVTAIDLNGLGGSKNYRIVSLATEENRFCLKKNLTIQQDNTLILTEDVAVNFHLTA